MLTRYQWCIPIPAVCSFFISRLWLNRSLFSGLFVKANQPSILCLCIDNIWVCWIGSAFKAVSSIGNKPVAINNSASVDGLRGSSQGVVILSSSVYVVKGPIVIYSYTVELDRRNISIPIPIFHSVPCLI